MIGLDTNVLQRYYIQDEAATSATQAQSQSAKTLIEAGQPLFIAKTVLLEFEWVLRGVYAFNKTQVGAVFAHLRSLPHLSFEDPIAVAMACKALQQGFDFADALHHASSRSCAKIVTFDNKGFAKKAEKFKLSPAVVCL